VYNFNLRRNDSIRNYSRAAPNGQLKLNNLTHTAGSGDQILFFF
jgi:hypothetical protein